MNVNIENIKNIIGKSPRFINAFGIPDGYSVLSEGTDEIGVKLYYEKLEYLSAHADELIKQAFRKEYHSFEGVDKSAVSSPEEMLAGLMIESFVLDTDEKTAECRLTNPGFMAGHYIECVWDLGWNFLYSDIF